MPNLSLRGLSKLEPAPFSSPFLSVIYSSDVNSWVLLAPNTALYPSRCAMLSLTFSTLKGGGILFFRMRLIVLLLEISDGRRSLTLTIPFASNIL